MFVDEVLDGLEQNLHVEGFRDEGIGPHFQTFDSILVTRLGCEQHYRQVIEQHIASNEAAKFHAIHIGHHHIAEHQVIPIGILEQFFERLSTIRARCHAINRLEFRCQITEYLIFVLDHKDATRTSIGTHRGLFRRLPYRLLHNCDFIQIVFQLRILYLLCNLFLVIIGIISCRQCE